MLSQKIKLYSRRLLEDNRGWFLKAITGMEYDLSNSIGEVYFTSAKPGQSKGGHYHKIAQEWFTMIVGKGVLILEDIDTKERLEISMDAKNPQTIYIPVNVAHMIVNTSAEDDIVCAYTDVMYNPQDTIAYDFK